MIEFLEDGVQANRGRLHDTSPAKGGWWPIEQEEQFVEALALTVLGAIGVEPAWD